MAALSPRYLIFKDVSSDGDDCDSHVDEGEQDEEGKDASGEAHERDKGLGAAALSWREDVCELVCARCRTKASRLPISRSSSMTAQLAAQRVHLLWEKYWLAAWQDE